MAEIGPSDLPAAVHARFAESADAQKAIDAALVAARRYCGWHVSPVREGEVLELDGPGGRVLSLPTLKLISVESVTEHGQTVPVSRLDKSSRKGTLTKPYGHWSCRDGAITAVITHGFTEAEAGDWRDAVVSLVDSWSEPPTRDSGDLKRKKVDDVEYEWMETLIDSDAELSAKFAQFRILPSP